MLRYFRRLWCRIIHRDSWKTDSVRVLVNSNVIILRRRCLECGECWLIKRTKSS